MWLEGRNAGQLLPEAIELLLEHGEHASSRNGDVIVYPEPVVTVIQRPWERVLFSPVRDANPFFHMIEAAWMLAGRNSVDDLTPYVKNFTDYADNGIVHGAYGHRWRNHFGYDQLAVIIEMLKNVSDTRQAVIQMWDCSPWHDWIEGLGAGGSDLISDWRDRPCNTQIYLRIHDNKLEMSVTNRSHDVIWGLLGANAVHFSVLQEYLAHLLVLDMGKLTFFSNNFHVYKSVLDKMLIDTDGPEDLVSEPYPNVVVGQGFSGGAGEIDRELSALWSVLDQWHKNNGIDRGTWPVMKYSWFLVDCGAAAMAHYHYRNKNMNGALTIAQSIHAPDWRKACTEWLERRVR